MKPIRLVILGTALTAGLGAGILAITSKAPPTKVVIHARVTTEDVLVAAKALSRGTKIEPGDLRWESWPKANVPPDVIRKGQIPAALVEYKGALVKSPIASGEPVYTERLIQAGTASFMAAILPSGMRAVSISIDQQGSQTAGGFIHPDDRVDVIHTYRDEAAAKAGVPDPMVSETLLRNIKVIAIGDDNQEQSNGHAVHGNTATLELTPAQVETIVLAQRVGQLSLALRSLADSHLADDKPTSMTIVRFGIPMQAQAR